ncbi:hypothetical protein SAY87_015956 [Trapa incisa]|uniref:Uncharacterized protein n=1 Tax=Trapa incisa TaxID=236973 RepID=A0AAN7L7L8_9MYRT|nr:hypothetical protein SAY87_015956 [Trapa incisa]
MQNKHRASARSPPTVYCSGVLSLTAVGAVSLSRENPTEASFFNCSDYSRLCPRPWKSVVTHSVLEMQAISRLLKSSLRLSSTRCGIVEFSCGGLQHITGYEGLYSSLGTLRFSGPIQDNGLSIGCRPIIQSASYSSGACIDGDGPTDTVKELHDKILESIDSKRTMAPNAWMWSMIDNCKNREDVKLLFEALEKLRRFVRKKTLWKHNVYGLTPSVTSAHHLLSHAKLHNDATLMDEVMKLVKRNDLPLQPGTADIVFIICNNADNWDLLTKYSKRFVKAGVKLHKASFEIWMNFAAKRGDSQKIWEIEKLRSQSIKQHSLGTAIACTKGFLLEGKPEEAAAVIQVLNEDIAFWIGQDHHERDWCKMRSFSPKTFTDGDPLISPFQALAAALRSNVRAMVNSVLKTGLQVNVSMEDLRKAEGITF